MSPTYGALRHPAPAGRSTRVRRAAFSSICIAALIAVTGCSGTSSATPAASGTPTETSASAAPPTPGTTETAPSAVPEPVDLGPQIPADQPCPAEAAACIDLTKSITWLQSNGQVSYGPVKMHAGMAGYRTPVGMYEVYRKVEMHYSQTFNNQPMPFSVFFNKTGIAFHEGSLVEPSHGCIHLEQTAAIQFFQTLQYGDSVFVYGDATY